MDEADGMQEGVSQFDIVKRDIAASSIQGFWRARVKERRAYRAVTDAAAAESSIVRTEHPATEHRRTALAAQLAELQSQRDALAARSLDLQRLISSSSSGEHHDADTSSADAEARYAESLARARDALAAAAAATAAADAHVAEAQARVSAHTARADDLEAKYAAARAAAGLPLTPDEVARAAEVTAVRVGYIAVRNALRKSAAELRVRERQRDGVQAVDFEQLKLENAALNEKIEERAEALIRLRKKAATTIHIITHIKEKLQFCTGECATLRRQLAAVDADLATSRDAVAAAKRARDGVAAENATMRQRAPLVGADDLLVDFARRRRSVAALSAEVLTLKAHHGEVAAWCSRASALLAASTPPPPPPAGRARALGPLSLPRATVG